MNENITTM